MIVPNLVSIPLAISKAMSASVATKAVALVLFAYFLSRLAESVIKLQERNIGTTTTRMFSYSIDYPTMTFCTFSNTYANTLHVKQ